MRKGLICVFIACCLFSHLTFGKSPSNRFFKKADKFFKKHVRNGSVDYKSLLNNIDELNELTSMIAVISVKDCKDKVKEAFYINAYNILVIKTIVDLYPVLYPLETTGLFSVVKHKVGEDTLTLNELERDILIQKFKDVRVLFVLTSASIGSPDLASFAYKPGKLDKQFKSRIKEICNSYDYVRVFKKSSLILMAEAFKRSQKDFNKDDIINLINKYREEPLPDGFAIGYYPVNRLLNIER